MLVNILKSDLYRFSKNKLFYSLVGLTVFIAFALTMLNRQDIRLGISVFGNLTMFRGIDDTIRMGVLYYNGLGIFVAILLSVFIGQEYQWKTWQHKWITSKSRTRIYLSKLVFSSAGSAVIFLIYQTVALINSTQIREILTAVYIARIISGLSMYAALGAVICMLSMLIKNNIASIIVCLLYVLLGETIASIMGNIGSISVAVGWFVDFGIRHSIYGMSTIVSSADFTAGHTAGIAINSLMIIFLSALIGVIVFRKYEL